MPIILPPYRVVSTSNASTPWGGAWVQAFNAALSNDNKTATGYGQNAAAVGPSLPPGGKYYFECTISVLAGWSPAIGVTSSDGSSYYAPIAYAYYSHPAAGPGNGYLVSGNNTAGGRYGDSIKQGDRIGVLLDQDAGTITFYNNGVSLGVAFTGVPKVSMRPFFQNVSNVGTTVIANFDAAQP